MSLPALTMQQFVCCLRKQISFQDGKYGLRHGMYYTANNNEMGLDIDTWGMIVFIHTAELYGFSDAEIIEELKIRPSLYDVIKESVPIHTTLQCPDPLLYKIIQTKIGLVKNSISHHYNVNSLS